MPNGSDARSVMMLFEKNLFSDFCRRKSGFAQLANGLELDAVTTSQVPESRRCPRPPKAKSTIPLLNFLERQVSVQFAAFPYQAGYLSHPKSPSPGAKGDGVFVSDNQNFIYPVPVDVFDQHARAYGNIRRIRTDRHWRYRLLAWEKNL